MPTSANHLLDVARREIGITEVPRGTNRTKYGEWFGLSPAPWCAEYVCWVAHHAGAPELVALPHRPKGSAYSGDILEFYKRQGRADMAPRPGDFVVWDWPNAGTNNDHIGIVETIYATGLGTIEGNSPGSGYTYDVVGRHVRHPTRFVRGFCHPTYGAPPTAPTSPKGPSDMYLIQGDKNPIVFATDFVSKQWVGALELDRTFKIFAADHKVNVIVQADCDGIPLVGAVPPGYAGEKA